MTPASNDDAQQEGTVDNGRVLTAAGWIPLRWLPTNATPPYYAGDVKGGHVFTGNEWVRMPAPAPAPQPRPMPSLAPPKNSSWIPWAALAAFLIVALGAAAWGISQQQQQDERAEARMTESTSTPSTAPSESPTATKKTKEAKKPRRKVPPSPVDNRIIVDGMWVHEDMHCEHNGYTSTVTGTITNVSGSTKSYVQITIGLFDGSGALLGNALANITNLADGTDWKYQAVGAVGDFATCQAQEVAAY